MRPQVSSPDLYAVLHLEPDCTEEDIRAQWRHLALVFHPDTHPGDAWFEEEFRKIEAAYEVLGNTERRAAYDRERLAGWQPPSFSEPAGVAPSTAHVAYASPPSEARAVEAEMPVRVLSRRLTAAAGALLVLVVMAVPIVRAVRGAHPAVPPSDQVIDGSALATPAYERSPDPVIRAQQDAYQARLAAVEPAVEQLITQAQETSSALTRQDRIDSNGNPTWSPPLNRLRDEAAINADIGELRFRVADAEQQIDQMATPAGADPGEIRQELDALEVSHQPIVDDIALAEHDLRAGEKSR